MFDPTVTALIIAALLAIIFVGGRIIAMNNKRSLDIVADSLDAKVFWDLSRLLFVVNHTSKGFDYEIGYEASTSSASSANLRSPRLDICLKRNGRGSFVIHPIEVKEPKFTAMKYGELVLTNDEKFDAKYRIRSRYKELVTDNFENEKRRDAVEELFSQGAKSLRYDEDGFTASWWPIDIYTKAQFDASFILESSKELGIICKRFESHRGGMSAPELAFKTSGWLFAFGVLGWLFYISVVDPAPKVAHVPDASKAVVTIPIENEDETAEEIYENTLENDVDEYIEEESEDEVTGGDSGDEVEVVE